MNNIARDPWQEAADAAAGHEGGLLKHDCKKAIVKLDGVEVDPGLRVCFLMSTACHGRIKFGDGNKVLERVSVPYSAAPPDRRFLDKSDGEKLTSVLCVGVSGEGVGEIMTYSGANASVRTAFETQLLRPFVRLKRKAFPVVTLGFKPGVDEFGNSRPSFNDIAWRPAKDFAAILGEEEPEAAQLEAPEHPAAGIPYLAHDVRAPEPADDGFMGIDPDDLIR